MNKRAGACDEPHDNAGDFIERASFCLANQERSCCLRAYTDR